MARLLIVANRLPVTVKLTEDGLQVELSSGGLATGLKGPHERSGGLWIGWPGIPGKLEGEQRAELERRFAALRLAPVMLSGEEVEQYYEGYSNGVLWPLFHYFIGELPLQLRHFDVYESVNRRFADAVVEHYRPGDTIWVHDYQLMLVPRMIRERLPGARIGFFLHIPFPSSEVFRTLPGGERLLEGLLGADLVGFHTATFVRHFINSALLVLGAAFDVDRIRWHGRQIQVGVFPMGIDARAFEATAGEPEVIRYCQELRARAHEQLLVGIDRLDYTKGISRRLLAFERLLRDYPELRGRVRLIQVAIPSRTNLETYQEARDQVNQLIGRIEGAFATPSWVPIHYLFRSLSPRELVGLYRAADVMVVTPIRDGMNLVAKEFVASRTDESGVLVLSEFAGAAAELAEAVHVNPYDVARTAEALHHALTLPADERRARMKALRRRVFAYDVHRWVQSFLGQLEQLGPGAGPPPVGPTPAAELRQLLDRLRRAGHLVLLLDYDGTLVPFAPTPELARPDPELLSLLGRLAARPNTWLHVVSGRMRETLERWLGALPIGLHAEHGFWSRMPGGGWVARHVPSMEWREPVLRILNDFAARTPGSLVEEKTASVAWHYRMAEPSFGNYQANELKLHLSALLSSAPVEVLPGSKVIEIRAHGINKGRVVAMVAGAAPADATWAALGDDRTDEDLFRALPPGATAIHVGPNDSIAPIRLEGVREARAFLDGLL